MSGIEIARRIAPTTEEGKFVKHGLEVIPMPSFTFKRDQDVFLYFEVYNLTRDAQGMDALPGRLYNCESWRVASVIWSCRASDG